MSTVKIINTYQRTDGHQVTVERWGKTVTVSISKSGRTTGVEMSLEDWKILIGQE